MGREGVVPERIGNAHRVFRTPHVALLVVMPAIVAVPILYLFMSGSSREVMIGLLAVSAHGYVGAYLLVCLAMPAFLRRIGELTRSPLVIGGLLATGFAFYAVRSRRVPGLAEHVGVFDETVAGDVLADYNPWMVRR
jgi:amino acid transporter